MNKLMEHQYVLAFEEKNLSKFANFANSGLKKHLYVDDNFRIVCFLYETTDVIDSKEWKKIVDFLYKNYKGEIMPFTSTRFSSRAVAKNVGLPTHSLWSELEVELGDEVKWKL